MEASAVSELESTARNQKHISSSKVLVKGKVSHCF